MIVACPDCGTVQRLPPVQRGHRLVCNRCAHRLERVRGNPIDVPLALALARPVT